MIFTVEVAFNMEIEEKQNLPKFLVEILGQTVSKVGPQRDSQLAYLHLKIHIHGFYC